MRRWGGRGREGGRDVQRETRNQPALPWRALSREPAFRALSKSILPLVFLGSFFGELFIHAPCCYSREPLGGRPKDLCEDRMSQLDGITGPMRDSWGSALLVHSHMWHSGHRSPCLLFLSYTIWVDGSAPNLYSLFSELMTCPECLSKCFERKSIFTARKTRDSQEIGQEFWDPFSSPISTFFLWVLCLPSSL